VTDAVFATKWDFLFAQVLIGVDRTTGVFSGSEPVPGQQMVAVWTSSAIAEDALHVEAWELRPIAVRELLRLLPPSIGVVVDPERPSGMTATAAYVANLKRYLPAFPAGSEVRLAPWESMPDGVRAALVQAVDGRVQELRAFTYSVDDSPLLGCLAHVALPGVDPADVTAATEAALSAATDAQALGLPRVEVVALDDVPDEVRSALGEGHVLHRRRRRRFLR
jgi:hypothetical protein